MTAIIATRLHCDFPRCPARFERSENYPATRRAAAEAGWTRRPYGGKRPLLDYDYCPAHPDGKEGAA
jgi:hypothetical protein